MITRLLLLFALVFAAFSPAQLLADQKDIDVAARGVVRVVIIQMMPDGARYVGHGTGFAVQPDKIVTNEHVIRQVLRSDNLVAVVVPSEGDDYTAAKVLRADARRDLALLEIVGDLRLPPLTLMTNFIPADKQVAAMGYPGVVEFPTIRSQGELIKSAVPITTRGSVSAERERNGVSLYLHQADIAGGNSGGPLVDDCGRVLGVNSAVTMSGQGEGEFYFAVQNRELLPFLRAADVNPKTTDLPCRSLADVQREQDARSAAVEAEQRAEAERRAAEVAAERERIEVEVREERENMMAVAAVLLVVAAGIGVFAAMNLQNQHSRPRGFILSAIAGVAAIGAAVVWIARPGDSDVADRLANGRDDGSSGDPALATGFQAGPVICALDLERSRITGAPKRDHEFEWGEAGCHGTTQYELRGDAWQRIFVPQEDYMVRTASINPATGEYRVERYLLPRSQWQIARDTRMSYEPPSCGALNGSERLGDLQDKVFDLLPDEPDERLVYACTNK
ncbi:serine protease [uncultured Erythrobacter sp.]|uniref:S1 family peptidase n=1 Tax=uncultured Erythrobacter sp. TaxID=263913 RepID=UPI00262DCE6C|nr:serine protease [uncultured Erythrobacter sp.]